jgi:anthranilate synthase component 1
MSYTPDFDEFCALAQEGNLVPVYREILADLETPVSAFLKIDDGGDAFLLESVLADELGLSKMGRYSFLGIEPRVVLRSKGKRFEIHGPGKHSESREVEDPLQAAKEFLAAYRPVAVKGLPRFSGGLVGYLSYDLVRFFERLPELARDDLDFPDQYLMLVDTLIVFDNRFHTMKVVSNADLTRTPDPRTAYAEACAKIDALLDRLGQRVAVPKQLRAASGPPRIEPDLPPAQYDSLVRRAKEYILAGDIIQVVLAQRFRCALRAHPFNIYRMLRSFEPSPYMFYLRVGEHTVIGSPPELMVRLDGREVTVRPIAGTRPRGTDERADEDMVRELVTDPKEIAEHIMLLDLGRNDIGRVARIGSVEVTERMIVERYAHVMHLVSNVRGQLLDSLDCFDAFRATFPAGTLSGAPKVRAMEIIEELEPIRRGLYGGAVGYFSFRGNMDTCITIRTMLIRDETIYLHAGAGIVADSDPEREHAECVNKARSLIQAVRLAEAMT